MFTMFYEHEVDGSPVILPLLAHYPKDKDAFSIDNEFLLQDRILVRPVMQHGVSKVGVYFPALDEKKTVGDVWYDADNYQKYERVGKESIAVNDYKERIRRSSPLMKNDPYTLIVCLDRNGKAEGTLYLDDEKSFDYRQGKFIYINYPMKRPTSYANLVWP
ncbi:neutral alpha-glucosidase AB-like isoform X2 [Musca autumnalis]|uniref:neutral alpha-glucosidase AB-like isoform X2 n=1 Tax=Musca autumnalis TaxID=221902 RepID=UPI003CF745FD